MRNILLSICYLFSLQSLMAYEWSHQSLSAYDSSRMRSVSYELYYPSDVSGESQPLPADLNRFPCLVFGHGFLMGTDAYMNLVQLMVPHGFVMLLPSTEGSISPSHADFAADMVFLNREMRRQNEDMSSALYHRLNGRSAVMGHSMGGGSSFLAAADTAGGFTVICNMAAAETSPSAIAAAASISIPALIFSGADDCVAPAAGNQDDMYDALASDCKTQLYIHRGTHCYFAESNLACTFGESTCNPLPSISRSEQQAVLNAHLLSWLQFQLQDTGAYADWMDAVDADTALSYRSECLPSAIENLSVPSEDWTLWPNPAGNMLHLYSEQSALIRIYDMQARLWRQTQIEPGISNLPLGNLPNGSYLLQRLQSDGLSYKMLRIVH